MGVSDRIGEIYAGIEDRFYAAMDFLSDRGIPVYAAIDPLEDRGIPAFPVILTSLIILVFLAYGFLFLAKSETVVVLSIRDERGNALSGVNIELFDEGGNPVQLGSTTFRDGQSVKVPWPLGSKLVLEARKENHQPVSQRVFLDSAETSILVELKRVIAQLEGAIRLVDAETDALVQGARISAKISEEAVINCTETGRGVYSCPGVIEGDQTQLTIDHANYEQKIFSTNFASESINEIALVPKASASMGTSNLIIRVFDAESRQRLGNYDLQIYDAVDNELITRLAETDSDGEHIEKISKGTQTRVVVQRENYITYDSGVAGENITLRGDEELREVFLRPGTNALTVTILDATGRPITNMEVLLHNSSGELVELKTTSLSGDVVFENLSTTQVYYVSSWGENFIPTREEVFLSESNRASLVMERATANNSGALTIYTVDEQSNALNNVTLNFFESIEGAGLAPLGIPSQKTGITGEYSLLAPLNVNLIVRASKGNLAGEGSTTILETFSNEMLITMAPPFSQVALTVLTENGEEVSSGFVSITGNESILFQGEYETGGVIFNPGENKYVDVIFTDDAGNTLEEQVYVEGLEAVSVSPKAKSQAGTNPELEYLGIFNIDGSPANGLAKGVDYHLKFRAAFPEGSSSNGIHVRLGEDSVRFADSQDAGITGFSASGATRFYGRSYSPFPEPGLEGIDFSNAGEEGTFNKFIELYFNSGGEKTAKVRVKAKETASTAAIPIHYRAWTRIANMHYRTPEDASLGLEEFSSEKTSLYAETNSETLKILEAGASCSNRLCASYKFVRSDGSEFKPAEFKAVLGEVYALEVSLVPAESADVTIRASTARTKPKIGFQGFTINDTTNFPDSNSTDTSIEVENIAAPGGEATGVRLYFKPSETENSSITLQLIAGETVINEQFYFEVFEEKALTLTTIPKNIVLGGNFVIVIENGNGTPIEDAEIILSSGSGEHLETIRGNGSVNAGGNGRYLVQNSFDAGTLRYEVRAPRHKPLTGTIEVTKEGVLQWENPENFIVIPAGSVNSEKFVNITNTSKQNVQEVTFEIEPIGSFPPGMGLSVAPLSSIPENSTQRAILIAEYTGESERSHGEARITARGRTETGFTVSAETKAVIDFNPRVPAECVEFSKSRLAIFVASGSEDRDFYDAQFGTLPPREPTKLYRYNNFTTSSSDSFTAKLAQKPACQGFELELKPETFSKGTRNEGIEVSAENIVLGPQVDTTEGARRTDTDEVIVTVTNNTIRNYPGKQKFSFDVVFSGNGFEKSLPVDVFVWNPRFALQVSRNIELFLGPDNRGQLSAQVPLFVRNIGEADIENVEISVSSRTSNTNVDITVAPPFPVQFLKKGQAITPPKTIVAQALRNERTTLVDVKELDVTGVIDGQTFSFGPIIVTSHISADQCLQAIPGNVDFFSTKSTGSLSKEIRVMNTCAEEARVIDVSEAPIGNNTLKLSPTNAFIGPGQEARFSLILDKKEDFQGAPVPVYIKAFLPRSGSPIDSTPIIVDLKLGKTALADDRVIETKVLPVCEAGAKEKNREVNFPIVATEKNPLCDNAYCDAVQMTNYLTDRLDQYVKSAERQVQSYQGQVQQRMCSQEELSRGFCSFESIGVKTDTFVVYMQHDAISTELMNKALKQKSGSVSNYSTNFISGDAGGEFLGGFSRQVYLNDNFRGCGRYNVTLRGNVRVQGGRTLVPELMNVVVDITPDDEENRSVSELTQQCLPRIQNIANYLPMDDGLTTSQKLGSWPGAIEATQDNLLEVSQSAAEKLFGSKERASKSVSGTNKIQLGYGETGNYIVRVEMDKTSGTSPITVRAFIREGLGGDEQFQRDIAQEAASAIANLRNNVVNGCIAEDESYVLLNSLSGQEKPGFEVKGKIPVRFEQAACTEMRVTSVLQETVELSGRKATEFDGITNESPFFSTIDGRSDPKGMKITELPLEDLNEMTHRYEAKALVCVEGTGQMQFANGKEVAITVKRLVGENKTPAEKNVSLEVCGIHPLDFLEKAGELERDKDYYATFIWKGEPEKIPFGTMKKFVAADNSVEGNEALEDRAPRDSDTPEVAGAKRSAANAYGAACAITSVATSTIRGVVFGFIGVGTGLVNLIVDCGIPWVALVGQDLPVIGDFLRNATEITERLLGFIGDGLSWAAERAGDLFSGIFKILGFLFGIESTDALSAVNAEYNALEDVDKIADSVALTSLIRDIFVGGRFAGGSDAFDTISPGTLSKAHVTGKNITESIIKDVKEKAFSGTYPPAQQATIDSFTNEFKTKLSANIKEEINKAATEKGPLRGRTLRGEELKAAIDKGVERTLNDNEVLTQFGKARNSIIPSSRVSPIVDKDKLVNELVDEIKSTSNITGVGTPEAPRTFTSDPSISMATDPLNPGSTVTSVQAIENQAKINLVNKVDRQFHSATGEKLPELVKQRLQDTISLEAIVEPQRVGDQLFPTENWVVRITKESQQEALREIETDIVTRLRSSALGTSTEFASLVEKKFADKAAVSLLEQAKAKVNPREALPRFGSGKWYLFIKNLLKEGALGLLANYVGLQAYDYVLERELGKQEGTPAIVNREEELAKAGLLNNDLSKLTFEAADGSFTELQKYQTYKVTRKAVTGAQPKLVFDPVRNAIPENAEVLCEIEGVDKSGAGTLPTIIPPVMDVITVYPEPFRETRALQELHKAMAKNYLKEQEDSGERYGVLIYEAVKDESGVFGEKTGLNLEALVASMGVMKSALGQDEQLKNQFMFGCDFRNTAKIGVYDNAECAVQDILGYADECVNDIACYLDMYSAEEKNLTPNISKFGSEEFEQIYSTWAGYAQ